MNERVRPKLAVENGESVFEPFRLGERVRAIRLERNWTLEEASRRTGLAKSTLSKIENEKLSPSFELVQKLTAGLGIDVPQLFVSAEDTRSSGRRTITRGGTGRRHPTATYEHELLCTELSNKKMIPFRSTIRARAFTDFAGWVRHSGEEFLFVLTGRVALYTEFYEPVELQPGDSAYYDSEMGHACVSVGDTDAQILWICTPSNDLQRLMP